MSDEQNQDKQLKLFSTAPHPCSYLENEEASTVFIDPDADIDTHTYTYLSEKGYRRSGRFLYRPDCLNCQACISIRIPVNQYKFSRSEKRILKKNADLEVYQVSSIFNDQYYQLYADYIFIRHSDGDMYPPSKDQYQSFLNNAYGNSQYFVFQEKDEPKAVAVVDALDNAYSAVYTFYSPFEPQRSFGSLAVLWQIQRAKQLGLEYVYLGYWVKNCQKMNYKTRFRPAEVYINNRWIPLT